MAPRRSSPLYRGEGKVVQRRAFERRYGKARGDRVYGATIGKVARERAARRPSGTVVEEVKGHVSFSASGAPEWVSRHEARVHAHPHGSRHHAGRCGPSCRRGNVTHRHRRTR
jgi:hypothetical protein